MSLTRTLILVVGATGLIAGWNGCSGDINVTTPPEVVWTFPVFGAVNVPPIDTIRVGFSRAMDPRSITLETFQVSGNAGDTVFTEGTVATYVVEPNLEFSTRYTVTLTDEIRDNDGTRLDGPYTWSFITRPRPPIVEGFSPTSGRAGDTTTIFGSHFSPQISGNSVRFNGFPMSGSAPIISASAQLIVAQVPIGATTGPVTVSTAGGAATSVNSFQLIHPSEIWQPGQSGTIRRLNSLIVFNSQFVAVGTVGELLVSNDGNLWEARQSGTLNSLEDIAWSGDRAVAVGTGGTILISPNGRNWSETESGTNRSLFGVTWTGQRFVAVGADGTILVSKDGTSWNRRPSGVAEWLFSVAAYQNRVVACGRNGVMLATDNTLSWVRKESGTGLDLLEVMYNDAVFLAAGEAGTLLSSSDGDIWTLIPTGVTSTLGALERGVTPGGPRLVLIGDDGVVLTSPDGIDWTVRQSGTVFDLHGVAWNGERFVAVGSGGAVVFSY